jgi:hypothetical protein
LPLLFRCAGRKGKKEIDDFINDDSSESESAEESSDSDNDKSARKNKNKSTEKSKKIEKEVKQKDDDEEEDAIKTSAPVRHPKSCLFFWLVYKCSPERSVCACAYACVCECLYS